MTRRMQESNETASTVDLVDARHAGMLLGISETTFRRMDAEGRCPASYPFCKAAKWWRKELLDWVDVGRPSRDVWEIMKRKGSANWKRPTTPVQQSNAATAAIGPGIGRAGNPSERHGLMGDAAKLDKWYGAMAHAGSGGDGRIRNMTNNDKDIKAVRVVSVVSELPPIMVTKEQAAALCGIGTTLWDELTTSGRNPTPRRLGRRLLWLREELEEWCRAGCPSREKWEILNAT